jgi:uncharacterized protein (UPF0548 family)
MALPKLLFFVYVTTLSYLIEAAASSGLATHDAVRLSRGKIARFRQKCARRKVHRRLERARSRTATASGSVITTKEPTSERISNWFWAREGTAYFNHDSVGMTNPSLHVDLLVDHGESTSTLPVSISYPPRCISEDPSSISTTISPTQKEWWPPTACPEQDLAESTWRVLRFRRDVGRGFACYQRVRDAALNWEFTSSQGDKGMRVIEPRALQKSHPKFEGRGYAAMAYEDAYAPLHSNRVVQISEEPGKGLVSFTTAGLRRLPFLPKLYVINPVSVVYDLIDQRGPGTTYSATAYATATGHWLRGEERVTVLHRDDGVVQVEILSVSKPSSTLTGRFVWPAIGNMQRTFFQQQMEALERAGI